jgi:hypothetical protein
MKYVASIALSSLAGCLAGFASSAPLAITEAVGPAPTEHAQATGKSTLEVYTARVRAPVDLNREVFEWNNDFGKNDFLYEAAHSDYTILSADGKVLQQVRNARGPSDFQPAVVSLAPGTYKIRAKARDYGEVTIPVVIEAARLTSVNLERYRSPVSDSVPRTDLVLLGRDRVVGWKAKADTLSQLH